MRQPVIERGSFDEPLWRVTFTEAARNVLAAACRRFGRQVVLLAWPAGATYLPCDSYLPGECDVVLGYVEGCPVYADTRRLALFTHRRLVRDADRRSPGRLHPPLHARAVLAVSDDARPAVALRPCSVCSGAPRR